MQHSSQAESLLPAARAGDAQAFAALAGAVSRLVRCSAALHAFSPDMLQRVVDETWVQARGQAASLPDAGHLAGWFHALVALVARTQLEALGEQASVTGDPLLRTLLVAALERLRSGESATDGAAEVRRRLERMPPTARKLIERRYVRGCTRAAISQEQGLGEREIAAAFCTARATLDWAGYGGMATDPSDRDTPLLIDGWLEGGLVGEPRQRLIAHVAERDDHAAAFERQLRIDLLLRALLSEIVEPAASVAEPPAPVAPVSSRRLAAVPPRRSPSDVARAARTGRTARPSALSPALLIGIGLALVAGCAVLAMAGRPTRTAPPAPATSSPAPVERPAPIQAPVAPVPVPAPLPAPAATVEDDVEETDAIVITSPRDGDQFSADGNIPIVISLADGQDGVRRVVLTLDDQRLGERSSPPFAFVWQGGSPGTHALRVRVTDAEGVTRRSRPVRVTIAKGADHAPRVALTAPSPDAVTSQRTMVLTAEADDPDGRVRRVEFYAGDLRLGESSIAPYRLQWTAPAAGTYQLTAKATDDQDQSRVSTAHTLTVMGEGAQLLVHSAPSPRRVDLVAAGTLDWLMADKDGGGRLTRRAADGGLIAWKQVGDVIYGHDSGPTAFAYSGGAPRPSANGARHGVKIIDVGEGFELSVPADPVPRRLVLHLGGWKTTARLSAAFADGGVAPFSGSFVHPDFRAHMHTIDYQSATPGQVLVVSWLITASSDKMGHVSFQAASLSGDRSGAKAPATPLISSVLPGSPTVNAAPAPIMPGAAAPVDAPIAPQPFNGTPAPIPGTLQVEEHDRGGEGVGYHDPRPADQKRLRPDGFILQPCPGGLASCYVDKGDWMAFTVDVAARGSYRLDLRSSSRSGGGRCHPESDGRDVTGPIELPSTGDWKVYTTVSAAGVQLEAGRQVLRLVFDHAPSGSHVGNVDHLTLVAE